MIVASRRQRKRRVERVRLWNGAHVGVKSEDGHGQASAFRKAFGLTKGQLRSRVQGGGDSETSLLIPREGGREMMKLSVAG